MKKGLFTPFYFPPIACFQALISHDVQLEWADHYRKQSYRNRCYIYGANGLLALRVPVSHEGERKGSARKIAYDTNWQRQHWRSLESAYLRAPYFEFYEDALRPLYERKEKFLYDLNLKALEIVYSLLGIDFSFKKVLGYEESPDDVVDFRSIFDPKYRDTGDFTAYIQVFETKHGFLPNLSILDLLFCMGPESIAYLTDSKR